MSKPPKIKPEHEVNAYLFYSQRLLHLLNSSLSIEHQADKMAITAAVCLSLKQAWLAWLKELSTYVGSEVQDLNSLLSSGMNHHPEVQLLNDLRKQPANWLAQLIIFLEPRLNTPTVLNESDEEVQAMNASSRINILQVGSEELSETEKLNAVISEFKAYINSVRSRQAEW